MTKLVNWGRWAVAVYFALHGLLILFVALASAIFLFREGSGSFYPPSQRLIVSAAFLLCSWGLVKMRNWAYWLAVGLSILEIIGTAAAFLTPRIAARVFGVVLEGIHFQLGSILIPVTTACACLVWLFLPSVRALYLEKEFAA